MPHLLDPRGAIRFGGLVRWWCLLVHSLPVSFFSLTLSVAMIGSLIALQESMRADLSSKMYTQEKKKKTQGNCAVNFLCVICRTWKQPIIANDLDILTNDAAQNTKTEICDASRENEQVKASKFILPARIAFFASHRTFTSVIGQDFFLFFRLQ